MVSVIVPVYNAEIYLDKCINSLCKQSYGNLQIILVDDGSTDYSGKICDRFQKYDDRIEVVHKENGGSSSARKEGLSIARGEYVAFVDADDWIEEKCIECLLRLNGQYHADVIAFSCVEEYEQYNNVINNNIDDGFYTKQWLMKNKEKWFVQDVFFTWGILPHLCDKLIKTDLIREQYNCIPNDISFGEDAACIFSCISVAESLLVVNKPFYHYVQHMGSIVKQQGEIKKANFVGLYHVLNSIFLDSILMQNKLKEYIFFTLLLKKYSALITDDDFFPFSKIKPGMRIMLYGAGGFGKVIHERLLNDNRFELVGWTDINWKSKEMEKLLLVDYKNIFINNYDVIIIAILNETIALNIAGNFVKKGISVEKIDYVRKSIIDSAKYPEWVVR